MSRKERIGIVLLVAVALAVLTVGWLAGGITLPFGRLGWPVATVSLLAPLALSTILD